MEHFIERLKFSRSEGHIVTISSFTGLFPSPTAVGSSSTNSSIISYMMALSEKIRREPSMSERIKTTSVCLKTSDSSYLKSQHQEVAEITKIIIKAIVEEENFVSIPCYLSTMARCLALLPTNIQQLARDLFLREDV